jgi:hypothetical protein
MAIEAPPGLDRADHQLGDPDPAAAPALPVYIRLPRQGELEFYSGLSKGTLQRLLKLPDSPVKSVVLTQPGTPGRGVKCILLSSLLDYLATLPSQPPARLVQPKRPPNPLADSRPGRKRKAAK